MAFQVAQKECRCHVQAITVDLDARTEFAILKANFSGAPRCRNACNIVLQHIIDRGERSMIVLMSAARHQNLLSRVHITLAFQACTHCSVQHSL